MTESTLTEVAERYLTALEQALTGLPGEVRTGILAGAREELVGLTAAEAAARIRELGDPEFIAAEARSETAEPALPAGTPTLREARWFPVVAALLVMVGGIVLPVVGGVAGLVMVWFSTAWTRAEKWLATLLPVAVAVLLGAAAAVGSLVPSDRPDAGGVASPLLPGPIDVITFGILGVIVVQVGVGAWLLVRAAKRA